MKKILLVLLLLFLIPLSAYGKIKYEVKGGILYGDGKKVTGTFELISEKNKAKGNFVNGLPDGIFERYYPDGSIMLKNTFVAGVRMTEEMYYKSGKLLLKASKKDDSLKLFYEDGSLVLSRNIKTGSYIIYHENGKPLVVSNGNISTLYNENNEMLFKVRNGEAVDIGATLKNLDDGSFELVKDNKVVAKVDRNGEVVNYLYATGETLMKANDVDGATEIFFKDGTTFFKAEGDNFAINYRNGKPLYKLEGDDWKFYNEEGDQIVSNFEIITDIKKID